MRRYLSASAWHEKVLLSCLPEFHGFWQIGKFSRLFGPFWIRGCLEPSNKYRTRTGATDIVLTKYFRQKCFSNRAHTALTRTVQKREQPDRIEKRERTSRFENSWYILQQFTIVYNNLGQLAATAWPGDWKS